MTGGGGGGSANAAQAQIQADESRLHRKKDSERIQREAFELFRTNDALRAFADGELIAKCFV